MRIATGGRGSPGLGRSVALTRDVGQAICASSCGSRRAVIAAKQPAESLVLDDFAVGRRFVVGVADELVPDALMRPFDVKVIDVGSKGASERVLAEEYHSVHALVLHRLDPSLGERVHVWGLVADRGRRDAGVLEDRLELRGEL